MKKITVAIDTGSSNECLYVDGKAWKNRGESTVYACDIAEVAGNEPILFEHLMVDCPGDWPTRLEKLSEAQ